MKDAHRALRDGTRAEHERLDGLFEAFDLADAGDYARFLSAHAEALLPVEAALDPVAGRVIADWADRKRSAEVLADLAALGVVPDPIRAEPVEAPFFFSIDTKKEPRFDTLGANGDSEGITPAIAGALYVIEGSRLGGRMLVKQVGAGLPTGYLGGEQPRGRWPALLDAIDAVLTDDPATEQAVATARRVFERFERAGRRWTRPTAALPTN